MAQSDTTSNDKNSTTISDNPNQLTTLESIHSNDGADTFLLSSSNHHHHSSSCLHQSLPDDEVLYKLKENPFILQDLDEETLQSGAQGYVVSVFVFHPRFIFIIIRFSLNEI